MAIEVILPRVDMDMAEGKIAHWYVEEGDLVTKGQVLFEIETDKAAMEVDSPAQGTIRGIRGEVGVTMPVGEVVAWILAPGEALPSDEVEQVGRPPTSAETKVERAAEVEPGIPSADTLAIAPLAPGRLLRATPLARNLARESGVELSALDGSGPQGRVLAADVAALGATSAPAHSLYLQWLREGQGTPLLLIHGFGAESGGWRALLAQLPESLPVVAVDLPAHGKSLGVPGHDLAGMARDVLARLEDEGVRTVHALGHSLGGGVALAMLGQATGLVRTLTLLAPFGIGVAPAVDFVEGLTQAQDETALKAVMRGMVHEPDWLSGSFVATAWQQLERPGRRGALQALAARILLAEHHRSAMNSTLAGARVPVHLVWGREDRIAPWAASTELPPTTGLHLLPGVGHLPHVEAAAWIGRIAALQCDAGD